MFPLPKTRREQKAMTFFKQRLIFSRTVQTQAPVPTSAAISKVSINNFNVFGAIGTNSIGGLLIISFAASAPGAATPSFNVIQH